MNTSIPEVFGLGMTALFLFLLVLPKLYRWTTWLGIAFTLQGLIFAVMSFYSSEHSTAALVMQPFLYLWLGSTIAGTVLRQIENYSYETFAQSLGLSGLWCLVSCFFTAFVFFGVTEGVRVDGIHDSFLPLCISVYLCIICVSIIYKNRAKVSQT